MVALSYSTRARSGMSMLMWVLWAFLLIYSPAHTQAKPNNKYGDVTGEEVVIDQIEDFLRLHGRHDEDLPRAYHPGRQNINEKIQFAVTPKDPRYYLRMRHPVEEVPSEEDLLRVLPPGLLSPRLQPQQQYVDGVLQYDDEETQYPAQYPQEEVFRGPNPGYPSNIRLPEMGISNRPFGSLQKDEDGANAVEEDGEERMEDKRMMSRDENLKSNIFMKKQFDDSKIKEVTQKGATSQPESVNYLNRAAVHAEQPGYLQQQQADNNSSGHLSDLYFTAIVVGCTTAAVFGVVGAGICWYRLNKSHGAARDTEYPAYGVTGPNKDLSPSSSDRKLHQSAHMYHFQHQKQQMITLQKSSGGERQGSASDVDSEEEGEENEYTVYECPGLAPTGEMEVKNPLFQDDPTPLTPSMKKEEEEEEDEEEEINTAK